MNDETKKIALVTGASRGIGKAIALELGKTTTVLGTATSKAGADKITAYLSEAGITGKGFCLDVSSEESIAEFTKKVQDEYGSVNILVNNAGITRDNILMRMKADEWDQVINTNLSSIFRMTKAMVRGMTKARWGRIISISSVVGSSGNVGQSNYAAAKAGMHGFTKSLAQEVASKGVTVNTVSPGYIMTAMVAAIGDEILEKIASTIPVGRLGNPDEIAYAVAFLASERAAFVTGSNLAINGGQHMF